jgi:hypothetical protein
MHSRIPAGVACRTWRLAMAFRLCPDWLSTPNPRTLRLVMIKEDPFVIQLVAHSADKLLIDAAKKMGTYLELDWELYIKDERHKEFFRDYRQTYNYFKHADTDFTQELPIYDIPSLNVMAVFMCAVNYVKLFKVSSHHVRVYFWFVQLLRPQIVKYPDAKFDEAFRQALEHLAGATPSELFEILSSRQQDFGLKLDDDKEFDLRDVLDLYRTSISRLRADNEARKETRAQVQN